MEETFSTPEVEQTAAKYMYGAYASIYHAKYSQAEQWIRMGQYKAAAEVLRSREDANYLLTLLNAEATRQKHAQVLKTSCEFQILNAVMQSQEVELEMLKRVALNNPSYASMAALKSRIKAIELELSIDPWEVPPDVVQSGGKKNDLTKWRVDKFPLKVFIPTDAACAKIKGYKTGDAQLLRSAFDAWQKLSGGRTKFVYTTQPGSADITCGWVSEQKLLTLPDAVGVCWQHSDSKKFMRFAEIKVLTFSENIFGHSGADNQFRKNALTEVCLHEIGHALGLNHSTSENDIMTYHVHAKPLVAPTTRDVSTLNTFYTTNINELITAALESVWSDKYDAATTSLDKIMAIVPKDQQTRETVCLLHVKMAKILMSRSEYAKAITHLSKSKYLLNGGESKKIKDLILKSLMYCYVKTGNNKAAEELDKQCQILAKPVQNSASFLDQYGLKPEAVPFYDKALADSPNDIAIREKFCYLLVTLAKDELKENHDEVAIDLLLKAKSMLVKGMSTQSIQKVMDALKHAYLYGQRYQEADNVWKDVGDILPKVENKSDVPKTPEQDIANLVAAAMAKRPSDFSNPGTKKVQLEKIKLAYEHYVNSLRQCAVAKRVKDVPGWAMRFVVLAKQYDRPNAQDPLGLMYKCRHNLIDLTDEGAVISIEISLPFNASEK